MIKHTHDVAIVGSGFAGIAMAHRLKMAGREDLILFEQSGTVGGVWRDNTYPGCASDIQSHLYSFSFEPNPQWSRKYPPQSEIVTYLEATVKKYGLERHIRFHTRITRLRFNERSGEWHVKAHNGELFKVKHIILAVGNLNRVSKPAIPGLEQFKGPVFHSAEWRGELSLQDRKVVVIGTGASAVQLVPGIAPKAGSLTVFQRSAPWIMPRADRGYTGVEKWLFEKIPALQALNRARIFLYNEVRGVAVFPSPLGRLVRPLVKWMALRHMRRAIADPALRKKATPADEFGCKRVLLSDDYYPALCRNNVRLVTDAIERVSAAAVHTRNGQCHAADIIVLGTGFNAGAVLDDMQITGRNRRNLASEWRHGSNPEAYLGITVNGFPNLYLLNGPNVGLGHNSVIFMLESQVDYVMSHMRLAGGLEPGRYLDVKRDIQRDYNAGLQKILGRSVWASGCSNWYRSAGGQTNIVLWPGSCIAYKRLTADADMADYEIVGALSGLGTEAAGDDVQAKVKSRILLQMDGREYAFDVKSGQSILEAALAQGVQVRHSCRSGFCTACVCRLHSGQVAMAEGHALSATEMNNGDVLICVGYAKSGRVTLEQT